MRILTLPTPIPSYALITSLSSSAVGPLSSAAVLCSSRCSTVEVSCSLTYSSLFATMSTMCPTRKPHLAATGTSKRMPFATITPTEIDPNHNFVDQHPKKNTPHHYDFIASRIMACLFCFPRSSGSHPTPSTTGILKWFTTVSDVHLRKD